MEERGMNARVKMLRKQSVETQPHIYMERAKLMTEAYKLYDGSMSVPEMRATALKYYFERKSIEIAEGELIDGHYISAITTGQINHIGSVENGMNLDDIRIYADKDLQVDITQEVKGNYDFDILKGTLTLQ